ncbi:MAG TPA: hypothetical protein VIA62_20990 [Thermoanaerobaculia bacterium]|jgi:hypothetical protein|nr:hypothetical protein [Thermoanaerobaculia bacterium]
MDKLLEIKIGGGSVHSGWLPLSALAMVRDLLDAIAAEGTDEDIWKSTDPQVEVIGRSSTLLAVHTNFARKLRPQVRSFREKAKRLTLGPKGRVFVRKHIATPSADWTYVDVIEVPTQREKEAVPEKSRVLRFDAHYKERLLEKQPEPIHGFDEVYAVVMRVGGAATPTVTLDFLVGDKGGTYSVASKDLAKRIAAHLYETVKLRVEASWNAKTFEIEKLTVHDLLEWRDVHLAEVYREHGNRLPIRLTVDSVEELVADREDDRSD